MSRGSLSLMILVAACTQPLPDRLDVDAATECDCDGDGICDDLSTEQYCGACDVACGAAERCRGEVCERVPIVDLVAGPEHACVLLEDGRSVCWGRNDNAESGVPNAMPTRLPGVVDGVGAATEISLGGEGSCAIVESDRSVWCWGLNRAARWFDGRTSAVLPPAPLTEMGVSHLALGGQYACVIRDGEIFCRGQDAAGQHMRGDAFTGEPQSASFVMADLPFADGERAARLVVAVGALPVSCVISTAQRLMCAGTNGVGILGRMTPESETPYLAETVPSVGNTTDVAMMAQAMCALDDLGSVRCWGTNSAGETGGPGLESRVSEPTLVALPMEEIVDIEGGGQFLIALARDRRRVFGWGSNVSQSLGPESGILTPRVVHTLEDGARIVKMAAGSSFICLLVEVGGETEVRCSGTNTRMQLGDPSVPGRRSELLPVPGLAL